MIHFEILVPLTVNSRLTEELGGLANTGLANSVDNPKNDRNQCDNAYE